MRLFIFISVLFVSLVTFGQGKNINVVSKTDSSLNSNDSVKQKKTNLFLGKLNKYIESATDTIEQDSLVILGLIEEKDPNIDLLIQDYIDNKSFQGYRIQIFASSEKLEALKKRAEFIKKYPSEKSYLVYQAPNFKVRVGNYSDRLITHEHLIPIQVDFPGAFIVKDEIEPFLK